MKNGSDDIEILIRPCSEETHRKTVDAWARQLAVLQDEVRAWCDAHPEAVEAERVRLGITA